MCDCHKGLQIQAFTLRHDGHGPQLMIMIIAFRTWQRQCDRVLVSRQRRNLESAYYLWRSRRGQLSVRSVAALDGCRITLHHSWERKHLLP